MVAITVVFGRRRRVWVRERPIPGLFVGEMNMRVGSGVVVCTSAGPGDEVDGWG